MNKARIYLIVGLAVGLLIGAGIFLGGRSVVNRVRATPRATPAPKAGVPVVPVPAKSGATPAATDSQVGAMEREAASLSRILGFTSYQWTPLLYPAGTSSADVLAHYNAEMQKTGWQGNPPSFTNAEGHPVWAWIENDSRSGLVVVYVGAASGGQVFVLTIAGDGPAMETPTPVP